MKDVNGAVGDLTAIADELAEKARYDEAIEAYNILQLAGDIVGLVNDLGKERAIIVGHDWGTVVAWHCALLRPERF